MELLRRFGAEVEVVKTAAIANPNHYCRVAQRRADEVRGWDLGCVSHVPFTT